MAMNKVHMHVISALLLPASILHTQTADSNVSIIPYVSQFACTLNPVGSGGHHRQPALQTHTDCLFVTAGFGFS